MRVRNFYVTGSADGRETSISGGPRTANGGMELKLFQRDEKSSTLVYFVDCRVDVDGALATRIYDRWGGLVAEHITKR